MRIQLENRLLAAVLAATPVIFVAGMAKAQFRTGEDGHALDASNRVGSGGVNDVTNRTATVNGNDIVEGNVTGGRQFRQGVGYTDPLAFRQGLPGRGVDAFLRDSSGIPTPYSPQFSLNDPRPFYGGSRGVAPPTGTVQMQFTGAFVGTSLEPQNPYASSLFASENSIITDTRLGDTSVVGYESSGTNLLALPGSLDSSAPNMQSVVTASPLTGVVQLNASQPGDRYFLERYLATRRNGEAVPDTIDDAAVAQMRQELQGAQDSGQLPQPPGANGVTPNSNPRSSQNGAQGAYDQSGQAADPNQAAGTAPLSPAGRQSSATAIPNRPLDAQIGQKPLGGQMGNQEGMRQRLLVPPARQSAQYADLQANLQKYNADHPQTDEEANRQFRRDLNQLQLRNGHKGNGKSSVQPSVPGGSGAPPAAKNPGSANIAPVKITSLATGIKARGLHELMASAEDLMRSDQFASAIQKYADAERVAPNNPLIALGRAHAELGAAYYGKAEADLRRVVMLDPAVLMGQFDLSAVMNAQRLAFVQKDLKDLTASEPKSPRPWFLLAYIAYNSGDAAAAAEDLAEAQKRTPGTDRVIAMMRSHWQLPTQAPGSKDQVQPRSSPELNK